MLIPERYYRNRKLKIQSCLNPTVLYTNQPTLVPAATVCMHDALGRQRKQQSQMTSQATPKGVPLPTQTRFTFIVVVQGLYFFTLGHFNTK